MTLVNLRELRLVYSVEPGFDHRNMSLGGAVCQELTDTTSP